MLKRFIAAAIFVLMASIGCQAQQTIVQATVLDPAGKAYQFATGSASIACPGNQAPLYNGFSVPRTITITGIDGNGHFQIVLYDVNAITPSGCSYNFAITAQNGFTSFTAPNIGASGSATPITGIGPVNLSTPINAYAVLLPSTGGGGTPVALQTNGATNPLQTVLNLKAGANTTLTSDLAGGVTVASAGAATGAPTNSVQYNCASILCGASGITTPDGNILNVKGPVPWVDATQYGMRTLSTFNTITVTTNGTGTVSTTGISDFIKNDGIMIPAAGANTIQSTPSAPSVTPIGATGAQSVSYECVGLDALNGWTAASAAGTTTTAPTIFGDVSAGITSVARASNVVTVNTSSSMPFSSGTLQAVIVNVTGGSTQFSGTQTVTVTSASSLTYAQTGADESGTATVNSYVLFKNIYAITQVQATAGSNQLVLTTSVNHNIPFVSSGTRPTRVFLDGIRFAGAPIPGYANGTFGVSGVTSNTITVTTGYVSPITVTATASATNATSQVAQMTVETWSAIDVACPAISGTTKYYAVYGNYGSGYSLVNFTPWGTNILEDYGPAFTQTGLVQPPGLNLPATPPVAPQAQAYVGQITNISGSTLTVSPSVTGSVSSVTARHDNGVAFNLALAATCTNSQFTPLYLPSPTSGFGYYLFSAPLDIAGSGCNKAIVVDGGPMWFDGPIHGTAFGTVEWIRPKNLSGCSNSSSGGNSGCQTYIFGNAPTMMVMEAGTTKIDGMQFGTRSNGQVGLMISGGSGGNINSPEISNSEFQTVGGNNLSSIPLYIYNTSFGIQLHNITFIGDKNWMYPIVDGFSNSELGDPSYWPVPSIEVTGAFVPKFKMDGINYGLYRGIQFDALYPNTHTISEVEISDVDTFQAPQQALINIWGSNTFIDSLKIVRDVTDSIINPVVSCIISGATTCSNGQLINELSANNGAGLLTSGPPWLKSTEYPVNGAKPTQNVTENVFNNDGWQTFGPSSGSNPAYQIWCEGSTGNALSTFDTTQTSRTGITCPGGLLSIGGTTGFTGTATQANTANRTYTFPDITGTLALLSTFAAPPAIGNTTPAAGNFTTLGATGNITTNVTGGGTQCLHVSNTGVVSGLGSDCGSSSASTVFSGLTSGTNTAAAMVVGTGASLTTSGSGTITATAMPFSGLSSSTNTTGALVLGTGSSLAVSGSGTNYATSLLGSTWAIPAAIGTGTPAAGTFSALTDTAIGAGTLPICANGAGASFTTTGCNGGGSVFPITVSGTVNSGGIPCFNSTTNEQSSAALAAGILIKGGGAGACVAASSITDNGTTVSTSEPLSAGNASFGGGCSAAGSTASGGICMTESANTGWTPTAGQDYMRADSTAHDFLCSINGGAEPGCTFGAPVTLNVNAIATTPTDAYQLFNNTASTGGVTAQYCPSLHLKGSAWNTTPTAANNVMDWIIYCTTNSAGTPFTTLNYASQVNGGGYVTRYSLNSFGQLDVPTQIGTAKYITDTNCAGVGTSASPSVVSCSSASAGHFSCATNATGATCTVNTTAVTANSEIFVFESDTAVTGTALGVTCNTSTNVLPTSRLLASSVAATSFTINLGTVTTNPACFSYYIPN